MQIVIRYDPGVVMALVVELVNAHELHHILVSADDLDDGAIQHCAAQRDRLLDALQAAVVWRLDHLDIDAPRIPRPAR